MQLNTDLKATLTELGKVIPKNLVEQYFESNPSLDVITINIKTPNIFYKKYYVFIESPTESSDITEHLGKEGLKKVKECMGVAYWNYFLHYNKQWSKKYYSVLYKRDPFKNNSLVPVDALEVD